MFQLAEKGRSKPMEVEQSAWEEESRRAPRIRTSADRRAPKEGEAEGAASDNHREQGEGRDGIPNRRATRRSDTRRICKWSRRVRR